MKKFFRFLVVAVMACFFVAPAMNQAEAAKVAVLPLVNLEEEENRAGAVFIKEAVEYFKYPAYDLVGDEILEPILTKENYAVVSKQGPNQAMLNRIMKASGADIVIMMRLNQLTDDSDYRGKEMMQKLVVKADVMALNAFTGKVYSDKVNKTDEIEYGLIVRSDWKHDQFAKICRHTFKDITKG